MAVEVVLAAGARTGALGILLATTFRLTLRRTTSTAR